MKQNRFLLSFVTLGLLGAVGCSGKHLTVGAEVLPDGGIVPSYPYVYEDECETVLHGHLVLVGLALEFPIYECQFDEEVPPPSDEPMTPPPGDDAGTPPGETDSGTPGEPTPDAGTPSEPTTDAGTPNEPEPDSSIPGEPTPDAGTPNEPETDSGTPGEPEVDSGTPNNPEPDAGTPNEPETDAGTPNEPEVDSGTPNEPETDSGTPGEPGVDSGCDKPEQEPRMCNRKITVVAHSGQTTTYRDDVLHCTFSIENSAVNTRVVRSCDKESEMAETKVIGVVGKSGQVKVILSTPHRCGHDHF